MRTTITMIDALTEHAVARFGWDGPDDTRTYVVDLPAVSDTKKTRTYIFRIKQEGEK